MIRLDNKMKFFFLINIAECRIVEVDLPIQNCIISILLPRKTLQRLLNVFLKVILHIYLSLRKFVTIMTI